MTLTNFFYYTVAKKEVRIFLLVDYLLDQYEIISSDSIP